METKTVLVTGIGGNVGQGILRNIRLLNYNLKIIGTNVELFSAGNHLVDTFYQVPFSYEENFLSVFSQIVESESVDLIIPSTDFETNILSLNSDIFKSKIACSGKISSSIYLDKYLTAIFHKEKSIPFVETFLPSEYQNQFSLAIAKPRKGRGSRGVIKNFKGLEIILDDEYLIQKMHLGIEITSAVYVSYISGDFIGLITMERKLENGATVYCKVIRNYDSKLEEIARKIIDNTDIKGAFNIQAIVTESEEIAVFEINCRISGTNSIRSHFGFEDVKYTIDELLYNRIIKGITTSQGEAFRYLADVIYPNGIERGTNKDNYKIF